MTRNAPMMVDFPLLLGPTNGIEGDFGEEQLVTVTFKESGGKTNMTLRHVGFLGRMVKLAGLGCNESFDKLAANLPKI